ncbi:succinate dehydrogenase assembly factor 2 [Gammaproteobacteria bacterium]|jgi:succinate dehydrogenase flavin-adding protein (antitoxin of CptAB toxin-antitoxin module)|nr:succinate dehydrogenase assembly factor 2 [Gammaproteobacteria bacterium]
MNLGLSRAKLTWRARRGARELDSLLLPYVQDRGAELNEDALKAMEQLLSESDPVLLDWFFERKVPPEPQVAALIHDILNYSGQRHRDQRSPGGS